MCFPLSLVPICGLVYVSTLPAPRNLADCYAEAAYDSGEEARFAAKTYFRLLRPWLASLPVKRRAVDIGTGNGALLSLLLADGVKEVLGIEPSHTAIAAAPAEIRPYIRQGMFSVDLLEGAQPDLVCAFQTLEHVDAPLAILRDIHATLRPGGAVALTVHNWQAQLNRILGRRLPIIDIEHLQLFNKNSLHRLFQESSFTPATIHSFCNTYPLKYWLRLLPLPSRLKRRITASIEAVGLSRLPVTLPVGNLFAVGIKEK